MKFGRIVPQLDCSSIKSTSTDIVGFLIRRHNFKTAAMTSFHTENCCHLIDSTYLLVKIYNSNIVPKQLKFINKNLSLQAINCTGSDSQQTRENTQNLH